jgi:hypothetical protein
MTAITAAVPTAPAVTVSRLERELTRGWPLLALAMAELIANGAFWLTGLFELVGADLLKTAFFIGWAAALASLAWTSVVVARRSSRTFTALGIGFLFLSIVLAYGLVFAIVMWAGSTS